MENGNNYSKWRPDLSDDDLARIEQLRGEIQPRVSLTRHLRKALGCSQSEVAIVLGMTQGAVSKMEVRDDISLDALVRLVAAKGGRLSLTVEDGDGNKTCVRLPE